MKRLFQEFDIRQYRLGFSGWGAGLFLLIMLPNLWWFWTAPPDDLLRNESAAAAADHIGAVLQVIMVSALCFLVHQPKRAIGKRALIAVGLAVAAYFSSWTAYNMGCINAAVILLLCLAPCIAFLILAAAQRNLIALCSAAGFTVCHLISTAATFIC